MPLTSPVYTIDQPRYFHWVSVIRALPVLLLACTTLSPFQPARAQEVPAVDAEVITVSRPLPENNEACTDSFVTHYLPHFTNSADGVIRMFQANGSGIAAGDLDGDRDLDLVLGSLHGPDSILWNIGDLTFRRQTFGDGNTRAITLVDVDADSLLDIVLTRATGEISFWRNKGNSEFSPTVLPGVARPASVLNWADMDADGDLDLVTASYDAGLLTDRGNSFLLDSGGIVHYRNEDGRFLPTVLETEAQGMAIALNDLNRDGRPDILVANDFVVPDYAWLQTDDGWVPIQPFTITSHSTMSIDFGDVNNDGALDLFTTDMMPFPGDASTLAAWHPVMSDMGGEHPADDPQHTVNVLQLSESDGAFTEQAKNWGVEATGWSWSSKFGDLDNDGFLDLYVVNGMIEERMFAHLPRHELIETNQAFRNLDGSGFVSAPEWSLDSRYSGRGSVIADLDLDGDLDIAVNNLRGPAQLFENRLCGGHSVQVELIDTKAANRNAIGARIELLTDATLTRDVRSASGYLSGDPPRVHFGIPIGANPESVRITWPDGAHSTVMAPEVDALLTVERLP